MMRERLKIERHEAMYGPHFNEEQALKAVSKMENEDGSRGEHWSLEEATSIANQYGINLKSEKFNKYDWYVALNMVRSDYYRAVVNMTNGDHIKYFVELTKAWINDKDIDEGKMWYYYCYVMCDKLRKESKSMLMFEDDEEMEKCKAILDQLDAEIEPQITAPQIDNSKEINDIKNEITDIKNTIAEAKKMFMGGFPKPPAMNFPVPQNKP